LQLTVAREPILEDSNQTEFREPSNENHAADDKAGKKGYTVWSYAKEFKCGNSGARADG